MIDVVTTRGMSPEAQAKVFAATDILVGVHGAGLTWAMMLPPNGVVIELSNYYRFGYLNGINVNCGTIYGSHAAMFRIHHILHFCPAQLKKPSKKSLLGERNRHVSLLPKTFIALLETAKCLVHAQGNDTAASECQLSKEDIPCNSCTDHFKVMKQAEYGPHRRCIMSDDDPYGYADPVLDEWSAKLGLVTTEQSPAPAAVEGSDSLLNGPASPPQAGSRSQSLSKEGPPTK